jgi:hypothetical protein
LRIFYARLKEDKPSNTMKKITFLLFFFGAMVSCDDSDQNQNSALKQPELLLQTQGSLIDHLHYMGINAKVLKEASATTEVYEFIGHPVQSDGQVYDFSKSELVYVHTTDKAILTTLYNNVSFELILDLRQELMNFKTSVDVDKGELQVVLSFLLANYKDISDPALMRSGYDEFSEKHLRKGAKAAPTDGCKQSTWATGGTKGDAIASTGTSPGPGCEKSGDAGCVCATGIWGGDIACVCVQIWDCDNDSLCLNVL